MVDVYVDKALEFSALPDAPYYVGAAVSSFSILVWLKNRQALSALNAVLCTAFVGAVFVMLKFGPALTMLAVDHDYSFVTRRGWPNPMGLLLGLTFVLIWHMMVFFYYALRCQLNVDLLQYNPVSRRPFLEEFATHLTQPESIIMVFLYLTSVWMFEIQPASYYDAEAPVNWWNILVYFLVTDFFIYLNHAVSHYIKPLYRVTHKPHHVYINPTMWNAFSGSIPDTTMLILIPLFITMKLVPHVGVQMSNWDFAVFGALYANHFMLLHIEYRNPWDYLLSILSIGVSEDHNVHHVSFIYNYGHFFMIYDKLFGTYRCPEQIRAMRSSHSREDKKRR
jgi:alternative squalene epoxidase